jgi:hypothetical protein
MATKFRDLFGNDCLGTVAIGLLSNSLAPSTHANYDNAIRRLFTFCAAEVIPPLHTTHATIVRYCAWLGMLGTVVARSVQPYFSAVNK